MDDLSLTKHSSPLIREFRQRRQLTVLVATVSIAMMFLLIIVAHESSGSASIVVRWILIAALAGVAWACSTRIAIVSSLAGIMFLTLLEWRTENWIEVLPGQTVRLIVAIGLVTWLCRLRDSVQWARQLSRIDDLTGLPNRLALMSALESELSRARRFGRPFSLALLDCDGFKEINDRQGHLAGDEVLRRIGKSLRENTRPFDCAGRWGGDEFLLVLSEVNHLDAELLAERLRAAIRHEVERDYPLLGFSLGVVTFADASLDWEDCLQRADEAMYAAKRTGRNETRFEVVE